MSVKCSDLVRQFDGAGDFMEWIQKLELVAKLQNIKDLTSFLPLFLSGSAFAVYQSLPQTDKDDYTIVRKTLTNAFSMCQFKAYEVFMGRRLGAGESVDVYLAELNRIAALISSAVDEEWIKCAFICGLPGDMKSQIQAACSLSTMKLSEVVEKARTLVSVRETCFVSISGGGQKAGVKSIRCFRCDGYGHMARECSSNNGRGSDDHVGHGATGRRQIGRGGGNRHCYVCGDVEHLAVQCPSRKKMAAKNE